MPQGDTQWFEPAGWYATKVMRQLGAAECGNAIAQIVGSPRASTNRAARLDCICVPTVKCEAAGWASSTVLALPLHCRLNERRDFAPRTPGHRHQNARQRSVPHGRRELP